MRFKIRGIIEPTFALYMCESHDNFGLVTKNLPMYVCSFYSDKLQYRFSAIRLRKQIIQVGLFDNTFFYSERKLFELLSRERNNLKKSFEIEKYSKGFAYWAWKPIIIHDVLNTIPKNSILLYLDIGCNLEKNINAWQAIIKKVNKVGLVTSNSRGIGYKRFGDKERTWTKPEVFTELAIAKKDQRTSQYQATWIMFKNNSVNQELVKKWIFYCTKNQFALIRPQLKQSSKKNGLVDHRNDQSILSCLIKKNGIFVAIADSLDMSIIRASRNLSLFSFDNTIFIYKLIKFIERKIIATLNLVFAK